MTTTTLYRFFNAAGQLLYVGISDRPFQRLHQHRGDKPWWLDIARTELQHFEDRSLAVAAELAAIRTEKPLYNIVGRTSRIVALPAVPEEPDEAVSDVEASTLEPPVGWWCHIATKPSGFDFVGEPVTTYPHGGGTRRARAADGIVQGKVVAQTGDLLLVRTFDWGWGEEMHIRPFRFDDPAKWRFYDRWDDWIDASDQLNGIQPGESRRATKFMSDLPIDPRTGRRIPGRKRRPPP